MKIYDIAIIGGDKRTACMADILAARGHNVTCFCLSEHDGSCKPPMYCTESLKEALDRSRIVICGIPFEQDGYVYCAREKTKIPLSELKRCLRKRHILFAGVISEDFKAMCEERGIACYDFLAEESLTLYNAVATAEGAILEALSHKSTLLHQSNTLVLGYGRCGRILAHKLAGLKACVTIADRNPEKLEMARSFGFCTLPLECVPREIPNYEYIFNTIPSCILNRDCLRKTSPDCLVIDIASNRTGVDYPSAKALKRQVLYYPGLPGKYSHTSCGIRLSDFVLDTCNK